MIVNKLAQLRQRCRTVDIIAKCQETIWYPVLFALLCMVAASFGMALYIPVFWVMAALVVFNALFSNHSRTLFVPIIMSYYAMGRDVIVSVSNISQNDMLGSFTAAGFANMIIAATFMLAAVLFRLVEDGLYLKAEAPEKLSAVFSIRHLNKTDDFLTLGLIALSLACMLSGLFSYKWVPLNLVMGFLLTLGFLFFYFISRIYISADNVRNVDNNEKHSFWTSIPATTDYVCFCFMALGLAVSGEMLIECIQINDLLFIRDELGTIVSMNREYAALGWGIYNLAAAVLAICFSCTLYLSYSAKGILGSIGYYVIAIILFFFIALSNCRDAILSSAIVFAIFLILSFILSGKRLVALGFLAFLLTGGIAIWFILKQKFGSSEEIISRFAYLFRFGQFFSGRTELWANAVNDFKEAPTFGVGFIDGGFTERNGNIYSNMYHSIGIQAMASMGVIGGIAFIMHLAGLINMGLRNCRKDKIMFTLIPFIFILISLVDNYFWYLNIQVLYCIILTAWSDTQRLKTSAKLI